MRVRRVNYVPRRVSSLIPGEPMDAYDIEWRHGPAVKFVVVKTRRALRALWKGLWRLRSGNAHQEAMGRDCIGFCHQCFTEAVKDGGTRMDVDARYAAVVVVLARKVSYEVLAHEAFHAGLAVARRRLKDPNFNMDDMDNEETAAYPAGQIATRSIQICKTLGLLK